MSLEFREVQEKNGYSFDAACGGRVNIKEIVEFERTNGGGDR